MRVTVAAFVDIMSITQTRIFQQEKHMALDVFLSHAQTDRQLRDELAAHLSTLRRQGIINEWSDGNIAPGSDYQEQLLLHLNQAQLILLLISADYLASDFCSSV